MTVYTCKRCGKFFNSDALRECPFCHAKVERKRRLKRN